MLKQPRRPDFPAKFFVISKQQFDTSGYRLRHSFQCPHGECEGGKIAFAHCRCTAVNFAVVDLAAVRVFCPTFTRRHHVAMGIEQNSFATAIFAAHYQIGNRLQSAGAYFCLGHWVFFSLHAHA